MRIGRVSLISLFGVALVCLAISPSALGQNPGGCDFSIVGTWKPVGADKLQPLFYRFAQDGTVTVLSGSGHGSDLREVGRATYQLDHLAAPKAISFTGAARGGLLAEGTTSFRVIRYDDASFTSIGPAGPVWGTRWVRVEPFRYFLVLAGHSGTFYDLSGPTFPILIKTDGQSSQIDAVGIYSVGNQRAFGPVPAEAYRGFMNESHNPSDVMLRLEISGVQYERSMKVLRNWKRRAAENLLLYPDVFMDNILLAKQITEGLNLCSETIKLYSLDWGIEDSISEKNRISNIPFKYFKELRRLNESLHVPDERFPSPGEGGPH